MRQFVLSMRENLLRTARQQWQCLCYRRCGSIILSELGNIARVLRSREEAAESDAKLVPVVIPETTIAGVTTNARVEYVRVR